MEKYRQYMRKETRTVTIKEPTKQVERKVDKVVQTDNDDIKTTVHAVEKNEQESCVVKKTDEVVPGQYINWSSRHGELGSQSWCCIGDLMAFCDKYEYKTISTNDERTHRQIVIEVKSLLNTPAPFDAKTRFPGDIQSPENLWVCLGRCPGVEYHLNRILSAFRKPLSKLSPDKQRMARQNFHLAVNELHLDITARILDIRLYDRTIFERDFKLQWQDTKG